MISLAMVVTPIYAGFQNEPGGIFVEVTDGINRNPVSSAFIIRGDNFTQMTTHAGTATFHNLLPGHLYSFIVNATGYIQSFFKVSVPSRIIEPIKIIMAPSPSISRIGTAGNIGPCTWFYSLDGTTPVAEAMIQITVGSTTYSPGDNLVGTAGQDQGNFINSNLMAVNNEDCFGPGTYSLSTTIKPKNGMTIRGLSRDAVTFTMPAWNTLTMMFELTSLIGVQLRDFSMDGVQGTDLTVGEGQQAIQIDGGGTRDIMVDNIKFSRQSGELVRVFCQNTSGCTRIVVSNCVDYGSVSAGFVTFDTVSYGYIINNPYVSTWDTTITIARSNNTVITGNVLKAINDGVVQNLLQNAGDLIEKQDVSHNILISAGGRSIAAQGISGSGQGIYRDAIWSDNQIYAPSTSCGVISLVLTVTRVKVLDNICKNAGSTGFEFDSSTGQTQFSYIDFSGNTIIGSSAQGFLFSMTGSTTAFAWSIQRNTFIDNGQTGATYGLGGNNLINSTVIGNMFIDDQVTQTQTTGYQMQIGSKGVLIIGNSCSSTANCIFVAGNVNPDKGTIIRDNLGQSAGSSNPWGKITSPFNTASVGLFGNTATVSASTTYTVEGVDIFATCTGGTGVSATISAPDGTTMDSGLNGLKNQWLVIGWRVNFGAFTGVVTCTVIGN
jgi:hypothetical protein